jgi:ribonuclease HII
MKNKPTYDLELDLRNQGYKYIIGIDEAGRGPLMGSVVAAGVYILDGFDTSEINDSKKLSAKKREYLYNKITAVTAGCHWAVSQVDQKMIDEINILEATKLAMRNVVYLMNEADIALIDGNFVPPNIDIPARAIIGGDNLSVSIAAASIIAKVTRDEMIMGMHKEYPIYSWDKNKGYGTKEHREAIALYGPCIYHRKTFSGVKGVE